MKRIITGGLLLTMGLISSLKAEERLTREAVIALIDQHLMENPEIIEKAVEALSMKKAAAKQIKNAQAIKTNKAVLFRADKSIILGSKAAKNAIVIFVDPYCPYCQQYHKMLEEALTTDNSFKVILKDLPLFGEPSQLAIQALIAAKKQGKYFEFYNQLVKKGKPQTQDQLRTIAANLKGVDLSLFEQDMLSSETLEAMQASTDLGKKLEIMAAPSVVIGSRIIEGAVPIEKIKKLLTEESQA